MDTTRVTWADAGNYGSVKRAASSLPIVSLRPRTLWDILDDTFDMYRDRFALFASAAALVYVPAYAIFIALYTPVAQAAVQSRSGDPFALLASMSAAFLFGIPAIGLAYVLHSGMTTLIVDDTMRGRTRRLAEVFRDAWRFVLPLVISSALVFIGIMAGTCALFVGAFVLFALYAFTTQAVVLEGAGPLQAISRSRNLCKSGFGTSLGLVFIVGILTGLLSTGISGILEVVLYFVKGVDEAGQAGQVFALRQALSSIVAIILAPIHSIAVTLLYYDLRVRREGLDVVAFAEESGYTLAPDPSIIEPRKR